MYKVGPSANNGYFTVHETYPNYVLLKGANSDEQCFFVFVVLWAWAIISVECNKKE